MTDFLQRPLSLARLELMVIDLPQVERFRSAVGFRHSREALFVRWVDQQGRWGIGECSCRPDPYFSHEFLAGACLLVADHLFPAVQGCRTYADLVRALDRIRGWQFPKASVMEAVHDLWRRDGLKDPVDAWSACRIDQVPVGISLGLYDSAEALCAKIGQSLDEGYRRIKLKIKPGLPPDYLRDARAAFPDAYLGCDANGSFDESTAHELKRLADLNLAMIEQPFAPDRLDLCAALKLEEPRLRICLDEGVADLGHLHAAIMLGAIDELNIKPGRVGGALKSLAMAELCAEHGIPVWIGGMFETGIGRAANLRFAACFPNAVAHDLSPSRRYFVEDLVDHPLDMSTPGFITRPDAPVAVSERQIEKFLVHRIVKDV